MNPPDGGVPADAVRLTFDGEADAAYVALGPDPGAGGVTRTVPVDLGGEPGIDVALNPSGPSTAMTASSHCPRSICSAGVGSNVTRSIVSNPSGSELSRRSVIAPFEHTA